MSDICIVDYCNKKTRRKDYCEMHYYRKRRNGSLYVPKTRTKKIQFVIDDHGCYICTSHKSLLNGYYHIRIHGKRKLMHRHVYEEMYGEISKGLYVRHKCDNPRCINPEHLEVGTPKDNSKDMVDRGRSKKGENHPRSKLTNDQVKEIRIMSSREIKRKDICNIFGIKNVDTITSITKKLTWKHID
jgi:hypothetical protein